MSTTLLSRWKAMALNCLTFHVAVARESGPRGKIQLKSPRKHLLVESIQVITE